MASTSSESTSTPIESPEKRLNDLMNEYLALKQTERKNIIADLHPAVRKRVYALQVLQKDTINLDAEFHRSVYELDRKFQEKHDEVFKKRCDIINGLYEPNDNECQLSNVELEKIVPVEGEEVPKGVPNFWLKVFKNVAEIHSMIEESDEPVLKHLIDVRSFSKPAPNLSFQIEFQFEPNEYFQNSVLTKTYLMKCVPDDEDPFEFEGPEIYKAIGCEIMWNAGKNVTEKVLTTRGSSNRLFKTNSFFNFFSPPEMRMEESEFNERLEEFLENDFEVGHYLKERVIPRAVLFFAGLIDDALSDEGDDDESETTTYHAENYDDQEATDGDD